MRITGGSLRGRTIPSGGFTDIRPTTDRARETIFNIIQNLMALEGASILDACAGTGALGFEAMSRGASSAIFVEKHRRNAELLRQTAQLLDVDRKTRILCADCLKAVSVLEGLKPNIEQTIPPINLIFCDPPYAAKLINPFFTTLQNSPILASDALFIAEHDTREVVLVPQGWAKCSERFFGETVVEFFRRE